MDHTRHCSQTSKKKITCSNQCTTPSDPSLYFRLVLEVIQYQTTNMIIFTHFTYRLDHWRWPHPRRRLGQVLPVRSCPVWRTNVPLCNLERATWCQLLNLQQREGERERETQHTTEKENEGRWISMCTVCKDRYVHPLYLRC